MTNTIQNVQILFKKLELEAYLSGIRSGHLTFSTGGHPQLEILIYYLNKFL